jgi:Berberine and berberine like
MPAHAETFAPARRSPAPGLRASFGSEKFERLVALKDSDDPDNVFALNPNIPPSVPSA